jgi:hypothetical protein
MTAQASSPRLVGSTLQLVSRLLRGPVIGPPLRRKLSGELVDKPLADLDLVAAGDPPPLYQPPSYDAARASHE